MANATTVTMYSTEWCGHCRRLKGQMDDNGIAYREVDLGDNEDAARRIEVATGGYRTVPTVQIGERLLVNPSLGEVRAVLGAASN